MELRDEKTIYTYYKNFRKDLIDFVYSVVVPAYPNIRTLFSKKWGKYLKGNFGVHLTEEEQKAFESYAITFEEHLLIAQELQQKKCTFQQIQNFFTYKLGIPTNMKSNRNVKIYPNINQILKTYQMELMEVNPILNTLPKIQKYCFVNYYKKELKIYQIAESLKCSNDVVIGCLNAVNNAFEAHQIGKLLDNLPKIKEIEVNSILKEEPKSIVASSPEQDSKEKKEESASKEPNNRMEKKTTPTNKHAKRETDIRIYQDREEVLKTYNLTEEQFQNILDEFSMEVKITCTYLIGIDRPKISIDKVADILKCNKKTVYEYLKTAYKVFAKNQNVNQNNIIMPKQSKKMKQSLYEGYAEEDKKYVTEVIEYWKCTNLKYYNLIIKVYGSTYNKLNIEAYKQLTEEEKKTLNNVHTRLKIMVDTRKNANKSTSTDHMKVANNGKGRRKKLSLYEGYAEEDKKYVTEVIEYWKCTNLKYYNLIIKVYGSTYDKINIEAYKQLTQEEKKTLNNVHTNLRTMVGTRKNANKSTSTNHMKVANNRKGRRKKLSLYEGYAEEDKKYVTEVMDYWKCTNLKYYNLIIKVYGSTYDKLNIEAYKQLTEEEKRLLSIVHASLKRMVKNRKWKEITGREKQILYEDKKNNPIAEINRERKLSILEYYNQENQSCATTQIEAWTQWWKENNEKCYDIVKELYEELNEKTILTEEEQKIWENIVQGFAKLVEVQKTKESFNLETKNNIKPDSNLDTMEKVDVPISDNRIGAVMGIKSTELPTTKQVGVEHSHELEQNNELVGFNHQNNNKKREILIKDIFPSEIIEIEKYVYTQMQSSNPKKQKDAIAAWDRLEKLTNQSIYDNESLQTMMNLLNRVQNSTISMKPVDEDTIVIRIKKL